jgi:hypothetical protein
MPRTGLQAGPGLSIELASWHVYEPGDVVIGNIVRTEQLVAPDARLTIRLHGRSKSKMVVKHQHGSSIYRGRFNFFGQEDAACAVFQGPIHIPPQGEAHSWPFAIPIPTRANAAVVANDNKEKYSYLSLQKDKIDAQPLPAIFYYKGTNFWSSTTFFGYVEYYLEAELVATSNGKTTTTIATLPLFINTPSTPKPLPAKDFPFQTKTDTYSARSYRLIPNMQRVDLSLKQKARAAFGSPKVPELRFTVDVACPQKVQLGTPVPFLVRVLPDLEASTKILESTSITFTLKSFHLKLQATTTVLCRGTFSSHDQSRTEDYKFELDTVFSKLSRPVILPSAPGFEHMDVGTFLQIVLDETSASALGLQTSAEFEKRVYPNLMTYNIQHTHRLRWELAVQVSGLDKWETMAGETEVEVIAPSQMQMRQKMKDLEGMEMKSKYKEWLEGAEIAIEGLTKTIEIVSAFVGN